MKFRKVTIIGIGLIGGSLAWALKKSGGVTEIFGVDLNEKAVDYAIQEGIIDRGSNEIERGVKQSEIIVIATHIGLIPGIAKSVFDIASKGSLITDVGSIKGKIVEEVEVSLPSQLYFVGGHPIAGTERSSVWAADYRLFQGKRCILTPTQKTQAVALALLNAVASEKEPDNILEFAGGGLRDYTRIGASSPDMWGDILIANKKNVIEALETFKGVLENIRLMIEREGIKDKPEDRIEVGILFVGAGPASLAGAIRVAQLLENEPELMASLGEIPIAIMEKGKYPGAHLVSGAVINPVAFRKLFSKLPKFEFPFYNPVEKETVYFLTSGSAFPFPVPPPTMQNHGNYVASISKVGTWLAEKAEGMGVLILNETAGMKLLVEDGVVKGVRTGDKGLDREGNPLGSFQPGSDVTAKVTVLGEGTQGHL